MKKEYLLIFTLWTFLTVINLNKAFHIDDAFHLVAAQEIIKNPLKPMSGFVNWGNDSYPLHTYNQPPLFMYLLAATISIFDDKEQTLHLLVSVFTFLALLFFYKILTLINAQNKTVLLVFFGISPALVVNQNVMIDTPLVALMLASSYYFLFAFLNPSYRNYCISFLILSTSLLCKYSLLPMLLVYFLSIIYRKHDQYLWTLAIPIVILSGWSFWNYFEFRSIHLLSRNPHQIEFNQFLAFFSCLGSISFFSISFVLALQNRLWVKIAIGFILGLIGIPMLLFYLGYFPEQPMDYVLNLLFLVNGILIVIIVGFHTAIKFVKIKLIETSQSYLLFFSLSFLLISSFLILFAPFMATRHILLVIPFILILGDDLFSVVSKNAIKLSLSLSIILGLLLGVSDWKYADYYRTMAQEISFPKNTKVYTAGHWGWQWYSTKSGMIQYNTNTTNVEIGDLIVCPGTVHMQQINKNIRLKTIEKKWKEADAFTFMNVANFASLYLSFHDKAPWHLSKRPIDTIYVCKVVGFKK